MSDLDLIIERIFLTHWVGDHVRNSLDEMKKQLHKNLSDQVNGYWSGHSAYQIMTKGGFLIDDKSCTNKKLTSLGNLFMDRYNEQINIKESNNDYSNKGK